VSVTWTLVDLADAVQQFNAAPAAMADDARDVVESEAQSAATEIVGQYPAISGTLRAGVGVEVMRGDAYYAGARVVSRSPEALWYEYGTADRHNAHGAFRGRVRPHFVLIRTMIAHRAKLNDYWRTLLRSFGLTVSDL